MQILAALSVRSHQRRQFISSTFAYRNDNVLKRTGARTFSCAASVPLLRLARPVFDNRSVTSIPVRRFLRSRAPQRLNARLPRARGRRQASSRSHIFNSFSSFRSFSGLITPFRAPELSTNSTMGPGVQFNGAAPGPPSFFNPLYEAARDPPSESISWKGVQTFSATNVRPV